MRNDSYLKVDKTNNEMYTPFYAVEPLLKYLLLTDYKKICCPFDEDWSAYVQRFKELGYTVTNSSLLSGTDFFSLDLRPYDVIISNPPFQYKDAVLAKLYESGKPFAMLFPLPTLQGNKRAKLFEQYGLQLLSFDKRIGFHSTISMRKITGIPCFASAYFCRDFLPKDLIVESLHVFERPLIPGSI